MIHQAFLAFALAAAAWPTVAVAQSEPAEETPTEQAPRPCTSEAHRQFDFWVGEWDVHRAGGGPTASNSIASLHGGCVIRESYTNPGGYSGMSLNYYGEADGEWHQLWLDNQGLVLKLKGGWNGKSMVLSSDESRITWTRPRTGACARSGSRPRTAGRPGTWSSTATTCAAKTLDSAHLTSPKK